MHGQISARWIVIQNRSSIPASPPSAALPSIPPPPVIDAATLRAVAPAGEDGRGRGDSVLTASLAVALVLTVFALLSSILPAVLPGRRGRTAREAMPKS